MITKFIVVEDDPACQELLAESISMHLKIEVETYQAIEPLLVGGNLPLNAFYLIDWNLPGKAGIELVKEIRKHSHLTPVLMMSGYQDKTYVNRGIEAGADDYLSKPCDEGMLLFKIRRCLERYEASVDRSVEGGLNLLSEGSLIVRDGRQVKLTQREFTVFTYLYKNQDACLPRDQIVEILDEKTSPRNADVIISTMRKKVETIGFDIQNKRGEGYYLKDRIPAGGVCRSFFAANLWDKVFNMRVFGRE